ncbi:MAG: glycosyltransferase family 2 protein [Paracoccaceae bacterium]
MDGGRDGDRGALLSIVVPVLDEEETVGPFLDALAPAIERVRARQPFALGAEVVFVDDGSRDRTVEVVRARRLAGGTIRLVKLSRNFGKDSALAAGLAHARGDMVVPMDVDLQDPPELLERMVEAWREGAFIVNAVRVDRSSDGWFKRRSAATFYRVFNRLSAYPLHTDVGDFRLLDRRVVDTLVAMPERVRFTKGLFAWLGYAPVTIEYARPPRSAGATKWKAWSLWNFALDGITGSTTLPLRVWTYAGGALALAAVGYAAIIVVRTLLYGVDTPGYASLMTVILVLSAIQLVALGILGEYIGRIAIEVRQRPLYLVEAVQEIDEDGVARPAGLAEAARPASLAGPVRPASLAEPARGRP